MKLYATIDDKKNIVSISKVSGDYLVEQDSLNVDFTKLEGYLLKLHEDTNTYELIFDEEKYNNFITAQQKEESLKAANEMKEEIVLASVLDNATDEQAYAMRYLYPEWLGNDLEYKTGDRFIFENKFYKVLQDHTSQADWLPTTATSLYVEIADPSNEYPEFKQPTGAHDAYAKGSKVTFEGKHYLYMADENVYNSTAYPARWQLVESY